MSASRPISTPAILQAVFIGLLLAIVMYVAGALTLGDGGLTFVTFCERRWDSDNCLRSLLGPSIFLVVLWPVVGAAYGLAKPYGGKLGMIAAGPSALVALLFGVIGLVPNGETPLIFRLPVLILYVVIPTIGLIIGARLGSRRWRVSL